MVLGGGADEESVGRHLLRSDIVHWICVRRAGIDVKSVIC